MFSPVKDIYFAFLFRIKKKEKSFIYVSKRGETTIGKLFHDKYSEYLIFIVILYVVVIVSKMVFIVNVLFVHPTVCIFVFIFIFKMQITELHYNDLTYPRNNTQ